MCVICIVAENAKNVKFNRKKRGQTMPVRCVRVFGSPVQGESCTGRKAFLRLPQGGRIGYLSKKLTHKKSPPCGRLFLWIYFARVRYRKVTISARVQIRFGLNVVPLVPMVISLPTAQSTASV